MADRKITFIKLQEKIKLEDGTVLEKGTSVRFNYKEGPFFNVELHDSHNVKKIFWITEEKGKVSATRTEKWTPKMMDEFIKDIKELWFDNDAAGQGKVYIDSLPGAFSLNQKGGSTKKTKKKNG